MSALTSHYQTVGLGIQVPEPGSQALMWERGYEGEVALTCSGPPGYQQQK